MPEAQVALGDMYRAGRGTPVDEKAAREMYEEAARNGSELAAQRLSLSASP